MDKKTTLEMIAAISNANGTSGFEDEVVAAIRPYAEGLGEITEDRISVIVPPDVKVETTFFQRKFFITEPCNYPQKITQKKNLRFLRSPYFTPFL